MKTQDDLLRLLSVCSFVFLGASLSVIGSLSYGLSENLAMAAFVPLSYLAIYGYVNFQRLEANNRRLQQENQKKDNEIASFIDKRKQLLLKMNKLQTKVDNQQRWGDQLRDDKKK